ncbi:DUF4435 domain-containing protein [Rhodopseudomonas palustris]|uniref:DUF4435 domain-containing protein n=1 Tax=Rhodopseudomonas palustris TaxID=1076 RepID=UPI0021F3B305|nr:DUF4435 domain-containing protein [Rhodopseudomonas palustris]UYO55693.1 DUF4435 domain-containing protein [Rhodopseudomonas palustris]
MISIARELDGFDIAQEIRQERQVHKGSFLLLEGERDIKRFGKFVDDDRCSIQNCFGRANLLKAIELLYEDGFLGVLGLADADFDRLDSCLVSHEGVIYSEAHDFDLDIARSDALQRYLLEVADQKKCEAVGDVDSICLNVMQACKPLSVLRYLNCIQSLGYKLSKIRHGEFSGCCSIDLDKLVDCVSQGKLSRNKDTLKLLVAKHIQVDYDLFQLTNGHDFFALLGIFLRSQLGSRLDPQSWGSEVEIHLRLAFSEIDFVESSLFKDIIAWEVENKPYKILKARLSAISEN